MSFINAPGKNTFIVYKKFGSDIDHNTCDIFEKIYFYKQKATKKHIDLESEDKEVIEGELLKCIHENQDEPEYSWGEFWEKGTKDKKYRDYLKLYFIYFIGCETTDDPEYLSFIKNGSNIIVYDKNFENNGKICRTLNSISDYRIKKCFVIYLNSDEDIKEDGGIIIKKELLANISMFKDNPEYSWNAFWEKEIGGKKYKDYLESCPIYFIDCKTTDDPEYLSFIKDGRNIIVYNKDFENNGNYIETLTSISGYYNKKCFEIHLNSDEDIERGGIIIKKELLANISMFKDDPEYSWDAFWKKEYEGSKRSECLPELKVNIIFANCNTNSNVDNLEVFRDGENSFVVCNYKNPHDREDTKKYYNYSYTRAEVIVLETIESKKNEYRNKHVFEDVNIRLVKDIEIRGCTLKRGVLEKIYKNINNTPNEFEKYIKEHTSLFDTYKQC